MKAVLLTKEESKGMTESAVRALDAPVEQDQVLLSLHFLQNGSNQLAALPPRTRSSRSAYTPRSRRNARNDKRHAQNSMIVTSRRRAWAVTVCLKPNILRCTTRWEQLLSQTRPNRRYGYETLFTV